jgi:hypothetical protein
MAQQPRRQSSLRLKMSSIQMGWVTTVSGARCARRSEQWRLWFWFIYPFGVCIVIQVHVAWISSVKAQPPTATLAHMPRLVRRLVPVQGAVHITVGRVESPLGRQHHMPHMVQVITVQHPQQQAFLLAHRASLPHSRYVCCDTCYCKYVMLRCVSCVEIHFHF